jgi:Fe-S cluster assembly iron-binding protein IscA
MLTITKEAAILLKVAKTAEGAPPDAGIRIVRGALSDDPESPAVGFTVSDDPEPDDEEFEQDGLRIFVEDALVEPLDGRILDVRYTDDEPELVLR